MNSEIFGNTIECPYCGAHIFWTDEDYVTCPRCKKNFCNKVDWENIFKSKESKDNINEKEKKEGEEALKKLLKLKLMGIGIIALFIAICLIPVLLHYPNVGAVLLGVDAIGFLFTFLIVLLTD